MCTCVECANADFFVYFQVFQTIGNAPWYEIKWDNSNIRRIFYSGTTLVATVSFTCKFAFCVLIFCDEKKVKKKLDSQHM